MDKRKAIGMKANAAIGHRTLGTIFKVATDRETNVRKLASNLVMAARVEMHLKKHPTVVEMDDIEIEGSELGVGHLRVVGKRLVETLVAKNPMFETRVDANETLVAWHKSNIGLAHLAVATRKHIVKTRESLARASEDTDTANGAVDAMSHTEKNLARLGVFVLNISF